jgi:hypothetical protein
MARLLIVLALVALALAGCGGPQADLVGSYVGEADLPQAYTEQLTRFGVPGGSKQAEMSLDLKADGTCSITRTGTDGAVVQSGDWVYDGASKTVTLNVTSPFLTQEGIEEMRSKGMSEEQVQKSIKIPMVSDPLSGGNLVFHIDMRGNDLKMTFKKKA